jgi:endonuclease/exonuclease/phosphatase family metal-dependent hydrolase
VTVSPRRVAAAAFAALVLAPVLASAEPPVHEPFRVLTYNVRQVNAADTGIYAWTERSPDVMLVIAEADPDIFGVQESSSPVIQDDLVAAFDAAYDRFQPTNGSPKTIFFRRGRFERLLEDPAEGEGVLGIGNPYAEDHPCHPNASGRTAAWVKLRDLVSRRGYLVINAHVAHGAACFAARNESAIAIQGLVAARGEGLTVVLMGDFNTDPQSTTAGPEGDETIALLEAEQAGWRLARSARHPGTTNAESATFNSAWKAPSTSYARLDYIFTSVADATTYWPVVDRREIDGISPSDHYAVAATIRTAPFGPEPHVDDREDGPGATIAFADVDGDFAADKMSWDAAVQGGAVRVHLASGDGGFGDPLPGAPAPAGTRLFFADLDGDGCSDRVDWDPAIDGGRLRIAASRCDGSFDASMESNDALTAAGERISFATLDADACADRIAWNPGSHEGRARVALSGCDGTFAPEIVGTGEDLSTNGDAALGFADVDGDGLVDEIVWDPAAYSGRTRVYAGNGDGTFTFASEHTGGTSGVSTSRFFYADVDADARADKIFWRDNFRQGHPQLYFGTATGFDPHPAMVNAGTSESPTQRWFLADIDGSGSADLVGWDPQESGATRAWLALVKAPTPEPPDVPPPDPDTGGQADDTTAGGEAGDGAEDEAGDATQAGSSAGGTGDDGTGAPESDGASEGCACGSGGGRKATPPGSAFLVFMVLLLRRRRALP